MRRSIRLVLATVTAVASVSLLANPASACTGVRCVVECVERLAAGERVCPD